MIALTDRQQPPLSDSFLPLVFLGAPFIIYCLGTCTRRSDPHSVTLVLSYTLCVGMYMTAVWIASQLLCVLFRYLLGWGCAWHGFYRSHSGPGISGDRQECWQQRASERAVRSADVLMLLTLAYAVSAAISVGIAMLAWIGAVWRKMRGGALVDSPVEKDGKRERDEKNVQHGKSEQLGPAEVIWDGGEEERRIGGWLVNGRSGSDKDDGDMNSHVLPISDHHENTSMDKNTASDYGATANDMPLLAVSFGYVAIVTYVLAHSVGCSPLGWRVRGTVAIMTLSPIVRELVPICTATLQLKLGRNRRKVVIAAVMGLAACVRLLLLLWLFGTALMDPTVELS